MPVFFKIIDTALVATGCIAVIAVIKAYRYVHEFRSVFKDIGLQELPDKRWIGAWNLWMKTGDLFAHEIELVRKYGKIFGYFEGRQPVIFMADPDMLKQVMVKDHDHFIDRRRLFPFRERPADLGLTNLTGPRWKHVRQQLTPTFTPANMRRMEPLISNVVNNLANNIARRADAGQSFDAKEFTGFYTLDVIASVAFGLDIDSFNHQDSPFVEHSRQVFQTVSLTGSFVAANLMFPDLVPYLIRYSPIWTLIGKMFAFFQTAIGNEMNRRRQDNEMQLRHDFLDLMMPHEKDPNDPANKDYVQIDDLGGVWLTNGLTRDEIYGQAILFFLAGYETTATTLMLTLLALCQNPEIQERLHDDIEAVFGRDGKITIERLQAVKYLDMVINETLRYLTPVVRVDRICTSDTVVNGLRVPKDVMIAIPINAVHHDPDLWPDPEKFDPERFAAGNEENIVPFSFLPFGHGNRNCIGMRLAQMELRLALARLVRDFRFTISTETKLPVRFDTPTGFRTPSEPVMLLPKRR